MPTNAVRVNTTWVSANAAATPLMRLMSAQGARSDQLTVVSYGEERPVCRVSDDECWSLNRRVEIVYTAK